MEHPFWILVPWAVFALGMGLKVWRIYGAMRRSAVPALGIEHFRQSLERAWAKDQQAA
ncbi:MAG: hypothetical protein WD136_04965 [Cyanobium sp.]